MTSSIDSYTLLFCKEDTFPSPELSSCVFWVKPMPLAFQGWLDDLHLANNNHTSGYYDCFSDGHMIQGRAGNSTPGTPSGTIKERGIFFFHHEG